MFEFLYIYILFFQQSFEVNTLLGDVLKHVGAERTQEQMHYSSLLMLVSTALTNSTDPHSLFSMVRVTVHPRWHISNSHPY